MAGLDRDGHPLLPHKFPGSGGPVKKKPPPKDPARDKPSDPGHGTPPVSGGGGGGGTGGPVHDSPSDPGHGTNPVTGSPYKPPAWVIRRQQVLRRAGYNIAVDGVWGAASERAWAAFTGQIKRAGVAPLTDFTPPGMVSVHGLLVPKGQAAAIRGIYQAQQHTAELFHEQKMSQVVRQAQQDAARSKNLVDAAFHSVQQGRGLPAGTAPSIAERVARRDAVRMKLQDESQLIDRTIQRIAGVSDTFIKGNPDWLEQRAKQGAVQLHDVVTLGHYGWLDLTDASDVRAVQYTLNHHSKHHADVTGQWDVQTNEAFASAWADQVAQDWQDAVHKTKHDYFDTHIAQPVLLHTLGHTLDPAQLTRLLQVGGPRADRVAVALGLAYVRHQEQRQLNQLRRARAGLLGASTALPFVSKGQQDFALRYLGTGQDAILADASTLRQYIRQASQWEEEMVQRQAKQANHETGYWAQVIGGYAKVLEPLDYLRSKTTPIVFGIQAELNSLWGGGFASIGRGGVGSRGSEGFIGWHEALHRGQITYADLPGWQGLVADILTDPLTYAGAGVLRGIAFHTLTAGERATVATIRAVDYGTPFLGERGVQLVRRNALEAGAAFLKYRNYRPLLAARGWAGAELAVKHPKAMLILLKATATRTEATALVRRTIRQSFITTLRSTVEQGEAARIGGALDAQAARAETFDNLFTPELLDSARRASEAHDAAVKLVAPDFVEELAAEVPISLYAHEGRRHAVLSLAGRRIEARLKDAAGRRVLSRLRLLDDIAARTEGGVAMPELHRLPLEALTAYHRAHYANTDKLLRELGGYGYAIPFDYIDQFNAEMLDFDKLLKEQLLPSLDQRILDRTPQRYDAAGFLIDEGAEDVRAALDRFFGTDIAAAFEKTESVVNPNHLREFTQADKEKLVGGELQQVRAGAESYGEMQVRLGGDADFWDGWARQQVADRAAALDKAWKYFPATGKWRDLRARIDIPLAVARGLELEGGSIAHKQAAQLAGAVIDAGRIHNLPTTAGVSMVDGHLVVNPMGPLALDPATLRNDIVTATLERMLGEKDGWQAFATATYRLAAAQAMGEEQIAARLYRENFLLLGYLRHKESVVARAAYGFIQKELALWKTAVLVARPAFYVKNQVDNFVKVFLKGTRNPKFWFNADGKSIFQMGHVRGMLACARYFDALHGTFVEANLRGILSHFWTMDEDTVKKVLNIHGVDFPDEILEAARTHAGVFDFPEDALAKADSVFDIPTSAITARQERLFSRAIHDAARKAGFKRAADLVHAATEWAWHTMAAAPEVYAKKAQFVDVYQKALKVEGTTDLQARAIALKATEDTLFDYGKITALESSLVPLIPFIFFFRKNAQFWASLLVEKPWFFVGADKAYQAHKDSNSDQPEWMRRYFSLDFVADVSEDAGLGFIAPWLRHQNIDPLNYTSFAFFYRAWKSENQSLPADRPGDWPFINTIVNGLNDYAGAGWNPLFTEPLQRLGHIDRRSWQDFFPQTTILEALTNTDFLRQYFGPDGRYAHLWGDTGFNVEDALLDPLFQRLAPNQPTGAQLAQQSFDELVNAELAYQALRGEPADIEKAKQKVRAAKLFTNLMGFTIGLYPKMISPEAQALYQMQSEMATGQTDFFDLTPQEQEAYQLFKRRKWGWSPRQMEQYRDTVQRAQVYWNIDNFDERDKYLAENPDVAQLVNPILRGEVPSERQLQTMLLSTDTDAVMQFTDHYLKGIGAAHDVNRAAFNTLATPSLRAFWAKNDTTAELRQRHAAGAYFQYIDIVDRSYRAIPSTDFEARQGFLDRHPELQDWWTANDGAADDYKSVMMSANSTFRTIYFDLVNRSGFDAADEFLRRHPFIFDFTTAEGRVNPDGSWNPKSNLQRDYARVAELERAYYALPKQARAAYLETHPNLARFWAKWGAKGQVRPTALAGGLSQHAKDYLAIKAVLDVYFSLAPGDRERFLEAHPELRDYFAKYSSERTQSQHARDYLAIKATLDRYFGLPDGERPAFLAAHPELKAYFDKYSSGKNGTTGHSYAAAVREGLAQNPDMASRYHFWMRFFALPPDQRAEFIHKHAAKAGIFIYGSLSYDQRQLEESRWHRQAMAGGQSDRAFLYLRVAPLLDIYFKLPEGGADRGLFLTMNPELRLYLDRYASNPIQNPHIAELAKHYFRLDPFSSQRSDYLDLHPELRDYFNRDPSPREAVIQRQLDAYFALPFEKRDQYAALHPELRHYFDQRAAEKQLFTNTAAAFNDADPRMRAFYDQYADIIPLDAMRLYWLRAQGKHPVDELIRTGRLPRTTDEALRRIDRAGTDPTLT
jgi:hypothetical protein